MIRDSRTLLLRLVRRPTRVGRLVCYGVVGANGVVIHLGVLWALRLWDILGTFSAPVVAMECAILHNFLGNELWVFRDRAQRAPRFGQRLRRLLCFHSICAMGAALHLGIVWLFTVHQQWPYMGTNLLAIAVVSVWNYGLNTSRAWTRGDASLTHAPGSYVAVGLLGPTEGRTRGSTGAKALKR